MPDVTLVNAVFPSPVTVPPHGILYLTSSLEAAGRSVEIRDYQLCSSAAPWEPETFAEFADADSPILGISCMSYALPLVIEAARILKGRNPQRRIVLGGIGPSPVASRVMGCSDGVDAVVVGEGERTLVELTAHLLVDRDLAAVGGIAYRDGQRVRVNAPRARTIALDELPWPAYAHIDFSRYRIANIQFGRGCPFKCSFCDIAPYWERRHTRRPVERFVDELQLLADEHGVRDVFFVDDTFVLSRSHVEHICDLILERGISISWGCYARTDLVSDALLRKMAAAGCQKIFYGVESGSDRLLESISKKATSATADTAVRAALEHMPFVTTSFVWGFPDETLDELESTATLLLYFAALGASPQLNLALPYSYSQLFREYRGRLRFSPEHSSQLCFYDAANLEWVCELIRRDTELFSAFYQLPTPDFARKLEYLNAVGLNPHALQAAFFEPSAAL